MTRTTLESLEGNRCTIRNKWQDTLSSSSSDKIGWKRLDEMLKDNSKTWLRSTRKARS